MYWLRFMGVGGAGRAFGARRLLVTPAAAALGDEADDVQVVAARSTLLFALEGLTDLETGAPVSTATVTVAVAAVSGAAAAGLSAVALLPVGGVPGDYRAAAAAAADLTPGVEYVATVRAVVGPDALEVRARLKVASYYGGDVVR